MFVQVVPPDDLPCIIDWLTCDQPLCPVQVCHSGKIEDAKSHFIKVIYCGRCVFQVTIPTCLYYVDTIICIADILSNVFFSQKLFKCCFI